MLGALAVIAANVIPPRPPHVDVPIDPRVGREARLAGCERGELVVPTVNVWDSPERTRVVGQIAVGPVAGRAACEGVPVIVRGVRDDLFEIESIDRRTRGWVGRTLVRD